LHQPAVRRLWASLSASSLSLSPPAIQLPHIRYFLNHPWLFSSSLLLLRSPRSHPSQPSDPSSLHAAVIVAVRRILRLYTMSRPGPRVHRLPHRTDFKLIPAPLDLSLHLVTEKSPLPAIIVTPSSPSSTHDFSIAFLAAPEKPSLRQRLSVSSAKAFASPSFRLRSIIFLLFVFFILVCHLVTHSLAARQPHLEFASQTVEVHAVEGSFRWFDFSSLFGRQAQDPVVEHVAREFVAAPNIAGARR